MARYRFGDVRDDGKIFQGYKKDGRQNWYTPSYYHRTRINVIRNAAKARAKKADIPFDLSLDYLVSIYPQDSVCPILGIPMVWNRMEDPRSNSPSLDRIHPAIGYVEGNVVWISHRANRIKSDATIEELRLIADFYEGM